MFVNLGIVAEVSIFLNENQKQNTLSRIHDTLTFQNPDPEPMRSCGDAGRMEPTSGRLSHGGSPGRTHLLDGEASR